MTVQEYANEVRRIGEQEGFAKGYKKGRKQKRDELITKMCKFGMTEEQIKNILDTQI